MKKKKLMLTLIVLTAVLLTVPFIPIRYGLKDGGTVVYDAMLYDVEKVQSIQADTLKGEMVDLVGTRVTILGMVVYDDCLLAKGTPDGFVPLPTFKPDEKPVLYLLDPSDTLHTYRPDRDGKTKIEYATVFHVNWEKNGCMFYYTDGQPNHGVWFVLQVGEDVTVRDNAIPVQSTYRFYLSAEGAPLPDSWNHLAEEKERIAQAQSQYGSFHAFATSRDREKERSLIDVWIPEERKERSEEWYDALLRALWTNGDLAVQFTDSEIVVHSNYVDLCLTGDNGKQYHLYGTSATYLIDMVACDGLYSYGPLI